MVGVEKYRFSDSVISLFWGAQNGRAEAHVGVSNFYLFCGFYFLPKGCQKYIFSRQLTLISICFRRRTPSIQHARRCCGTKRKITNHLLMVLISFLRCGNKKTERQARRTVTRTTKICLFLIIHLNSRHKPPNAS
jgi:hypothetical protein